MAHSTYSHRPPDDNFEEYQIRRKPYQDDNYYPNYDRFRNGKNEPYGHNHPEYKRVDQDYNRGSQQDYRTNSSSRQENYYAETVDGNKDRSNESTKKKSFGRQIPIVYSASNESDFGATALRHSRGEKEENHNYSRQSQPARYGDKDEHGRNRREDERQTETSIRSDYHSKQEKLRSTNAVKLAPVTSNALDTVGQVKRFGRQIPIASENKSAPERKNEKKNRRTQNGYLHACRGMKRFGRQMAAEIAAENYEPLDNFVSSDSESSEYESSDDEAERKNSLSDILTYGHRAESDVAMKDKNDPCNSQGINNGPTQEDYEKLLELYQKLSFQATGFQKQINSLTCYTNNLDQQLKRAKSNCEIAEITLEKTKNELDSEKQLNSKLWNQNEKRIDDLERKLQESQMVIDWQSNQITELQKKIEKQEVTVEAAKKNDYEDDENEGW